MSKQKNSKLSQLKNKIDHELHNDAMDIAKSARDKLSHVAERYLDVVIDPKRSKPARIPTLLGGDPGLTGLIKLKKEGDLVCGTQGFGYLTIGDSTYSGFYSDIAFGSVTTSATLFTSDQVGSGVVAGVTQLQFTTSPYTAAADGLAGVTYRLVGLSVEIFPESSFSEQNGSIALLEPPNHQGQSGNNFEGIATQKRARILRGTQWGELKDKITLNVHPIACLENNMHARNPFAFHNFTVANSSVANGVNSAVIAIAASAGTSFRYEINAVYEIKGKRIPNRKIGLTDSRGMNLVLNTVRDKRQSGWVGQPHHAKLSYFAHLWKAAKSISPSEIYHKSRRLIDNASSALSLIGQVAGFSPV